ncbi:hypothetical protein [Flavobacterium reichenbachii]|uniref:Uncharacterized protein n=1 Tax=Flavobacterium reichenbachii TaxID=362418 RepID=A0A085ZPR3_9FLAO|nr:hypothetical protein [Flavobacterium reichenbachii]KFF06427.1 hypothetical protein IW19_13300 [Flavobacterium reichenbachii]OXB14590.1 hypothetical protein B0A68_12175 [Flavobacterium reichenbachii]
MKLYTLKADFGTYMNRTQSVDPSDNLPFSGGNYNEDEDFTDTINKLKFRLARDVNEKKMTSDFLYEAIDFYDDPLIVIPNQKKSLQFFTVSPKLKKLLEQIELPEHKFYPIMLNINKGIDLPYYILQIKSAMSYYRDYSKSSFYALNLVSDEFLFYKEGEIKSTEQLLGLLDDDIFPYDKSMYINQELDWVYMAPFFMISEKSKQLFEDNNIVGMEITPFYEVESDYGKPNDLGYLNKFGGREIIINGKSTMDGLDINDFPRADKE